MPRANRISSLGNPHLIVAKANTGSLLFYDDQDFHAYLQNLHQQVRDKILNVHAYCLLPRELRLIVSPQRLPLPRIIQRLHGSHTLRVNHRHGRIGTIFQGRYLSKLFDHTELASAVRSVHLWPVRLELVKRAENYPFSSHRAYMNSYDKYADMLSRQDVYDAFHPNKIFAQNAFDRYVESASLEPDDYGITSSEYIQDNGDDVVERKKKDTSIHALAKKAALFLNVTIAQILSNSRRQDVVMARRLIASAAVLQADRSVSEVARKLNRDKAQISRLVSQGLDLLELDVPFKSLFLAMTSKGTSLNAVKSNLKEHEI